MAEHNFVQEREDLIILTEPIKRYTDHLDFAVLPCNQDEQDRAGTGVECLEEEAFLSFLEDNEAFISFFWIDQQLKTYEEFAENYDSIEHIKTDSQQYFKVLPRFREKEVKMRGTTLQTVIYFDYKEVKVHFDEYDRDHPT
jgi:hypothetical protein